MSDLTTVQEVDPVNAAVFEAESDFYARRFDYLVQRRDQLVDRIRFGSLAINAASLIALVAALGGDGQAAAWVGLNPPRAQTATACFLAGLLSAAIAIFFDANRDRKEAGDAFARRSKAMMLAALHRARFNPADDTIAREMEAFHKLPLVDFQYSKLALTFQALAGGCWIGGVWGPLSHLLGWA